MNNIEFNEIEKSILLFGFDKVGYFHNVDFTDYLDTIQSREEYLKMKYIDEKDYEEMTTLDEHKTYLVLLMYYKKSNSYKNESYKISNRARYMWQNFNPRIESVVRYLRNLGFYAKRKMIPQRIAASRAGLGRIGKNTLFYSDECGSYVAIGTIVTNIPFAKKVESDEKRPLKQCIGCDLCIRACPVNAISRKGFEIEPLKCLSFINRHMDEDNKEWPKEVPKYSRWLDGCEICQDVCPVNRKIKFIPNFHLDELPLNLFGMKIDNRAWISKQEFDEVLKQEMDEEYKRYLELIYESDVHE